MSKTWVKWGMIVAGSTLVALNVGACLADVIIQQLVLSAVD